MTGEIKKLVRDRGFGFITAEDGQDIFFHASALEPGAYDSLSEGDAVQFEIEEGDRGKGPRATQVTVTPK